MEIKQGIVFSSPSGGSFGFVPDWSKMVAITASYTVPADGYVSVGYPQPSDVAPLLVDGFRIASESICQILGTDTADSWRLLPCFKGQYISSVPPNCYFVPLSRVAIKAPNTAAAVAFTSGESTTANGYISAELLDGTGSSIPATINGNIVMRLSYTDKGGHTPGTFSRYWFFAPMLKGTTFSGSGTIKFIPFKS